MYHRIVVGFLLLLLTSALAAKVDAPEPLAPWADWVAERVPDRDCPFLQPGDTRGCQWVTGLNLVLTDAGGRFRLTGQAHAEGWLLLPGSSAYWPSEVLLNQQPASLLAHQGRPALRFGPGRFVVDGAFAWQTLPNALSIPAQVGLVRLQIDGLKMPVNRDREGQLWLRDSAPPVADQMEDRLDLRVQRRLSDTVPMRLQTRLVLDVAGQARELLLGSPLLEGFIPIALQSKLPARIEPDGRLRVQIRPGQWTLVVDAYHPDEVTRLAVPPRDDNWPEEEVWAFEAQHHLRLVEPTGLVQVDPRQTTLPKAWQVFPAYLAVPGQSLSFEVRRRGDAQPEPDVLALERNLWLDFDGAGYTVQDRLSGTITRTWRLEADPVLALGRVAVDGQDQLITRRTDDDVRGVEIRRGNLQLVADSRYEGDRAQLPVGWLHDLNSARAVLHLPPGWDLLAVSGVDNDPTTWLQRWTLLDLFLVLIAGIAVARLWGLAAGALALAALVVTWHAPGAPQQVWLHWIAALALLRVMPPGRLRVVVGAYRTIAVVALLLIAVPFLIDQARALVYPQLAVDRFAYRGASSYDAMPQPAEAEVVRREKRLADGVASLAAPKASAYLGSYNRPLDYQRIDPSANVQTGPGLPRWQWRQVVLGWNGPVPQDQRVTLTLLSPTETRLLRGMRIILLTLLALALLRDRRPGGPRAWLAALDPRRPGAADA